ncbi:cation transporter [candidate division KSB1 bacterium]|nr:cation transporter [candidate division KSB1 bacterium]
MASLVITLIKFGTAIVTNSLAMYSEAGHSLVDTLAVVITFAAIKKALEPPDPEHPFGHAKYESVGALAQLILLIGIGGLIVYNALERLFIRPEPVEIGPLVYGVMAVSIVVEGWRTVSLMRAARQTGSEALAASSTHFLTDFLDSFVVVFGLIMAGIGYPKADSIAALFVAGVVFMLSIRLGRDVFNSLVDRAPEGVAEDVERIVRGVHDVIGVHDIRVRRAGTQLFTEMHVDLDATMPLGDTHAILDLVEYELRNKYPTMHVVTHPEPVAAGAAASS